MTHSISLPYWLFLILLALAAWAAFERLLLPPLRWYFRRRVNRVIDEIGTRFSIQLPQFKLTRRQVLIDRLFHDPKVAEAAERIMREENLSRSQVLRRVDRYAREIVPSFNAYLYFRVGYWLAKRFARALYRVRLGYADERALGAIAPESTVVFVINHRSNMDYVLVAFLAAEKVALSYAVGEWARVWPLQTLIRSMGAYFVRRNSGDALYRMVLQRYVQMATEAGVPQALFPEGGLSIDGRLRPPKLGLVDYMMKGFDPAGERDLVFIPVALNYDRVLEDRTLVRKLDRDAAPPRLATAVGTTLRFLLSQLGLALTGRWYRFGYACVNFGAPISMREYLRANGGDFRALPEDERRRAVETLGGRLMTAIGAVVPVLPAALVATVFRTDPEACLSELDVKLAVRDLMDRLAERGAHLYIPRSDQDYAISVGLRMLVLRNVVSDTDGLYTAAAGQGPLLDYYANSIAHLLDTA